MNHPRNCPVDMKYLYERIKNYLNDKSNATVVSNVDFEWPNMYFWEFIIDVTKLLMDHDCQKMKLYAEILSLCYRLCWSNVTFSVELIPLLQWILQLRDCQVLLSKITCPRMDPKKIKKLMTTSYKYAYSEVNQHDPVELAAVLGNVGLLELLLKFGIVPLKPNFDELSDLETRMTIISGQIHRNLEIDDPPHKQQIISHRLKQLDEHQRLRMFHFSRVLLSFNSILTAPKKAHLYVASIKLLFKSIPEPFVTSKEITEMIEILLCGEIPHDSIFAFCKQFEEYFPESCELPGPKSLKHLSRCQIRDNLRVAASLPTGVKYLPLPNKLKDYVLLRDDRYLKCNPILKMLDDDKENPTTLYNLPKSY